MGARWARGEPIRARGRCEENQIKFRLMKTIKRVVRELRREENRVQSELQRISNALDALQWLSRSQLKQEVKKVRKFSATTRKKMAAAQRARWAKLKKAI